MKQFNKAIFILIMVFFTSRTVFSKTIDMADAMRQNGKIYVVVGVLALIFLGLMVYLIMQEIRIKKLEEKLKG